MIKARGQAERYVRALPGGEGNPPFIIVVDVGHSFELFADFTQAGQSLTCLFQTRARFAYGWPNLSRRENPGNVSRFVWTNPARP